MNNTKPWKYIIILYGNNHFCNTIRFDRAVYTSNMMNFLVFSHNFKRDNFKFIKTLNNNILHNINQI